MPVFKLRVLKNASDDLLRGGAGFLRNFKLDAGQIVILDEIEQHLFTSDRKASGSSAMSVTMLIVSSA